MTQNHRGSSHGLTAVNMDHLRNVSRMTNESLYTCTCGFYGWLTKEEEA